MFNAGKPLAVWSNGMMHAQCARGPGFNSQNGPHTHLKMHPQMMRRFLGGCSARPQMICYLLVFNGFLAFNSADTVSEWSRRWTRNPLGSARRGSNPLGVDLDASSARDAI